jgi:hypothetical protein
LKPYPSAWNLPRSTNKRDRVFILGVIMRKQPSLFSGQIFNKLTVLRWDKSNKNWICQCQCGNIVNSRANLLTTNKHKSCKNCMEYNHFILPNNLGSKRHFYRQYIRGAKSRKHEFSLSFDEFMNIVNKNCFYCGDLPSTKCHAMNGKSSMLFNGIDRINNSIGYIKENCVSCCSICNRAKRDMLLEDWKLWINRITEFNKK